MKAEALSVTEISWTLEECRCRPVDEQQLRDPQVDGLCLPNIFRSRKVKPLGCRTQSGPSYQVYYTARELLLDVLDRASVRELVRRAAGLKAGANPSGEEEYAEVLTWFSIVLQSGLSTGDSRSFGSDLTLRLDGWQGVLKRNSFQSSLLSLTRLDRHHEDKLDALSAFCSHVTSRYQALYTPGQQLAVKKYQLSCGPAPCPLLLAVLCDLSSGFICNMFLFSAERLRRRSRRPVVEQVVEKLLRPFCSLRLLVQLDRSAWTEGGLTDLFSGFGVNIDLVPTVKRRVTDPAVRPHPRRRRTSEDLLSRLASHLQGWTGPALLPPSSAAEDGFLPGLWATLHIICINTFVLHTLQSPGSGRRVHLTQFTRALASQLAVDSSVSVPVLPRLNSSEDQESSSQTNLPQQRTNCGEVTEPENSSSSSISAVKLHSWNTPGVCGLDNSGNSCYLNAVLQCLCSTVPLVEHLLHQDTRKELARCRCRVAEVFVRLLEQMWLGRSSSCAPAEAWSVLCSILPQFNNSSQQDAQELLLFLLNALHDNLKKVGRKQVCVSSSMRRPRQDRNRSCESTIVSQLFEGELSYVTVCMSCRQRTHSSQTFTVLSLPLPSDIISCSIQDCLALFFQQTVLTGPEQVMCSGCSLRRETAVLTCLDKPPEILMLHLKRFGCKGKNQVKLKTNVVFSTRLDLTPFVSSSVQNNSYSSYRLYAVVNHAGHLNMGHYTSLCLNAVTQTWHSFDDSAVKEVKENCVQSPNAYLLLYSRRRFHKPKIHGL